MRFVHANTLREMHSCHTQPVVAQSEEKIHIPVVDAVMTFSSSQVSIADIRTEVVPPPSTTVHSVDDVSSSLDVYQHLEIKA